MSGSIETCLVDVIAPMTADEARILTDQITQTATDLWRLLLKAYEGQAWLALGYPNWRTYAQTELNLGQSHVYRLLDHGRVMRALEAATSSPIGEINEHTARLIKPHLSEVVARLEKGEAPTEAIRTVVDETVHQTDDNVVVMTSSLMTMSVGKRTDYYCSSHKRADRSNRMIATIATQADNYTDGIHRDFDALDLDALDCECLPRWIEDIRKAGRRYLRFAERLANPNPLRRVRKSERDRIIGAPPVTDSTSSGSASGTRLLS